MTVRLGAALALALLAGAAGCTRILCRDPQTGRIDSCYPESKPKRRGTVVERPYYFDASARPNMTGDVSRFPMEQFVAGPHLAGGTYSSSVAIPDGARP